LPSLLLPIEYREGEAPAEPVNEVQQELHSPIRSFALPQELK